MYDPCAVRILMVRPFTEDCCGCSQAINKDCSRLCKSTLSSMASTFSNISQTACRCNSFLVSSWSLCCHLTVLGDCCFVSLNRWNGIRLPSTNFCLVPFDWCGWPSWSVDRCIPSAFMLLIWCLSCLVALCCLCCGHLNKTKIMNCNEYNEMKMSKFDEVVQNDVMMFKPTKLHLYKDTSHSKAYIGL